METVNRTARQAAQESYRRVNRIMVALGNPVVDKTIATIAVLPFAYALYRRVTAGEMNIPRACAAIGILVVIVTMLLRTAPQRVSPNPLWWLLAFVATYGPLASTAFLPPGRPIVPDATSDILAIASLVIVVYARWSLGRNIGFVPAQRQLVSTGAYGYVRHPIYTALMLAWVALLLRAYSPAAALILSVQCALLVIKSLVEEGFLRHDPEYAAYMLQVRHRFIPGIV